MSAFGAKRTQQDNMRSLWTTSRIIWNNINERFISSNRRDREEKENTNFTTILLEFYSVVKMKMRRLRRSVYFTLREKKKCKATVYHFDMIFHIIECIEIAQKPQYHYYHLKSSVYCIDTTTFLSRKQQRFYREYCWIKLSQQWI